MALLFIDSFDHYSTADVHTKWPILTDAAAIAPGVGRCGTQALVMAAPATLSRGIPFAAATAYVGFAFKLLSVGTTPGRSFQICGLSAPDNALASLNYNGTTAALEVQLHDTGSAVVLGSTPPNTIFADVWYFLEWKLVAGDAPAGATTVRVNNVPQIALTGIDTIVNFPRPSPTPRAFSFSSSSFGGGQTYYIDDFYALDETGPAPGNTFLGDSRIEYLRPRANGVSQAWSLTGAATHWQAVDDNVAPDADVSYIEANAAGLTDTIQYQPTGLPAGLLFAAQLSLYARKTEVGPRVIGPVVNGAPSGAQYAPSIDTYQYYSTLYPTNPATGLPWTIAEINAAEFGVTVVT